MSHLGDIAQALPLVHGLRAAWPEIQLAWAIQPEFAGLVEPLARIIPFDRKGGVGAWPRIRRNLRDFDPDLALDAQGNWKSAFATRLSGAGQRMGFARPHWQEPLAARILGVDTAPTAVGDTQSPGPPATSHLVDRACALAAAITGLAPTRRDPDLSEAELVRGQDLLGDLSAPIILHPGVDGDRRSWPSTRFEELARRLVAAKKQLIILTGPGESEVGSRLRDALPERDTGIRHLVGQRGLRDLAAFFAAAAKRSGVVVVGDSGPAHVAASVDLPVCFLAGPEDPSRTGPWPVTSAPGSPHTLIDPPRSRASSKGASSGEPWNPRTIESISVDAALAAILMSRA